MLKCVTNKRNLCWALAHNVRNFSGRSFWQKITLILLTVTGILGTVAGPAAASKSSDGTVTYRAVVCGIENYQGTDYDLDYCHEDADGFRSKLLFWPNWNSGNITLLKYSVTKSQIRTAIQNMCAAADEDDVCVFFFSGHGTTGPDVYPYDEYDWPYEDVDEYLVTYDGLVWDSYWDEYYVDLDKCIRDDEFGDWMADCPTNKYVIFLDACNSGGQIKGAIKIKGIGNIIPQKGDGFAADLVARMRAKDLDDNYCGVVVTACDDDEVCIERADLQHGVFTYCLLNGMGGLADDNYNNRISAEECYYYARPCALNYYDQHAQMYDGHSGELEFLGVEPSCSPPEGVSASDGTYTDYVRITWIAVGNPCIYYRVYRAESSTETPEPLSTWQTSTTYNDTTAEPGTTYYYWVRSAKSSSGSDASDYSSYNTGWRKLSPPTGVSIDCDTWCIEWNSVTGASNYRVYRATSPTGTKTALGNWQSSLDYCNSTIVCSPGTTYYYWIQAATNSSGDRPSDYSQHVYCQCPSPPAAHNSSIVTPVDTPVTITLQAIDDGYPDPPAALRYTIMSLPIHGYLNDPCAGPIIDPCTSLLDYGNQVEYIPDTGYEGWDSFTFIADDNGVPPGGGESNEATVSINVTTCIFFDDFPSMTLDNNNWPDTSGMPTVDNTAGNEPSPIYSLHLEDSDSVTSRVVDLYGCRSAQLHYSLKRISTESGDDLSVDYWDGNEWKTLQMLSGGADTVWEPNSAALPADALHPEFRLRFRADCDSTDDEWYIDDVCIQCQSCIEPPLLHTEPNTTQGTCNRIYWDPVADANGYYAQCANDVNFENIDANSGWIIDTNHEFCGLTSGQKYWYHVKARAPLLLKTWLQTSQVDFETDTLTDTIATADGNVVLAGGSIAFLEDFEDGDYDGWIHGSSSCTREVVDDTAAAGTMYSFSQTGPCTHYQGVSYTLSPCTPDSFTFYVRTESTEASGYVVLVGSDISHRIVWFYMVDNQIRVYQDKAYSTSCNLLTWYKVEFIFNWQAETFDFYVSDALIAANIPFRDQGANSLETIYLNDLYGTQSWWDEIEFSNGSGGGYTPIGDIVSTVINLPVDGNWDVVDFNKTTPADTELTVDILPAASLTPISGYENVSDGADLSGIGDPNIRIRANLSTADTNNTPILHDWSVIYTDPALTCESGWSNEVNSTQEVISWEMGATHGGSIGEIWCEISDGYVEPRTSGIGKLRICFDTEMDTSVNDISEMISVEGVIGGIQPVTGSVVWESSTCMVVELLPVLADEDTYTIILKDAIKTEQGVSIEETSICLTALKGDANGNRSVNSGDLLAIRSHINQPVDCSNARYDINLSGLINSGDLLAARLFIQGSAPACP